MLKITNPHFRRLISIISPNTKLFTEMIVASTVIYAKDIKNKLGCPINTVVQIGGSEPEQIAKAVQIIKNCGFTSFNLNCGCPSTKVKKGCFGAILMTMPDIVVNIINTVYEETGVVLSIKCRIGVDDNESFDFFLGFIDKIIKNTKCRTFYVHCRKCLLNGISPKDNRTIPPLDYSFAEKIKEMYKDIKVYINGGIKSYNDMKYKTNGYMIGREAVKNPFVFAEIENAYIKYNSKAEENVKNTNYSRHQDIIEQLDKTIIDNETYKKEKDINSTNTVQANKCNFITVNKIDDIKPLDRKQKNIELHSNDYKIINNNMQKIDHTKIEDKNNDDDEFLDQNKNNDKSVCNEYTLTMRKKVILAYLSFYDETATAHLVNPIMQILKGNKNNKKYKEILNNAVKNKMDVNGLRNMLIDWLNTIDNEIIYE
ncbi:hypothetical protein BDAP_002687 [Binucleata daphniae]